MTHPRIKPAARAPAWGKALFIIKVINSFLICISAIGRGVIVRHELAWKVARAHSIDILAKIYSEMRQLPQLDLVVKTP